MRRKMGCAVVVLGIGLAAAGAMVGATVLMAQGAGAPGAPAEEAPAEILDPAPNLPIAGDAAPPAEAPATIPIFASLDTTATSVGGSVILDLLIPGEGGWQVEPPTPEMDLEGFRIRSIERRPVPEGSSWRLRLVALKAGDVSVGPVRLAARGPEGEKAVAESEPLPLTVQSNLPPPDPAAEGEAPAEPEPADLKPALEPPRDWRPLAVAAAALILAAILGFWLLRKLRGREPAEAAPAPIVRKPLRPAWETALEELDRIVSADYVGQGQLDRQYVEVTDTLRQYLEDRYGVLALESTTTELAALLARTPLPPDQASRVLELLREADLVKFAKAVPLPADARATEPRARQIVRATMPREEAAA